MLGFSFFYAASLESISTKIHSINLIGETFVALTTILQVVLWSGPLQLLLCVLMNYCLLSVKSSKQRTNLTNLAQNPPRHCEPPKKEKENKTKSTTACPPHLCFIGCFTCKLNRLGENTRGYGDYIELYRGTRVVRAIQWL
jgi:hypothetical protein